MLTQRRLGSFPGGGVGPHQPFQRRSPYSHSEKTIRNKVQYPHFPPPHEKRGKEAKNKSNEYSKEVYRTKVIKIHGSRVIELEDEFEDYMFNPPTQVRYTDTRMTITPRVLAMRSAYNTKVRNDKQVKATVAMETVSKKQGQCKFKQVEFIRPGRDIPANREPPTVTHKPEVPSNVSTSRVSPPSDSVSGESEGTNLPPPTKFARLHQGTISSSNKAGDILF